MNSHCFIVLLRQIYMFSLCSWLCDLHKTKSKKRLKYKIEKNFFFWFWWVKSHWITEWLFYYLLNVLVVMFFFNDNLRLSSALYFPSNFPISILLHKLWAVKQSSLLVVLCMCVCVRRETRTFIAFSYLWYDNQHATWLEICIYPKIRFKFFTKLNRL